MYLQEPLGLQVLMSCNRDTRSEGVGSIPDEWRAGASLCCSVTRGRLLTARMTTSFSRSTPPNASNIPQNLLQNSAFLPSTTLWSGTAWSVQRLATGVSSPGENEIFRNHPDRPWGPPTLLHIGCRVPFPGVSRPGLCVNQPPPPSVEVEERVELYLHSPSGPP